jgi:hypothetical protein
MVVVTHLSAAFGPPVSLSTTARIQRIRQKSAEAMTVIVDAGTHFVVQGTNIINGTCNAAMAAMVPQNHGCCHSFRFKTSIKPSTKILFEDGKKRSSFPTLSNSPEHR